MLAIVAAILAVLAGFDVTAGEVSPFDFLAFAVACLALHLAYPIGWPQRRTVP